MNAEDNLELSGGLGDSINISKELENRVLKFVRFACYGGSDSQTRISDVNGNG